MTFTELSMTLLAALTCFQGIDSSHRSLNTLFSDLKISRSLALTLTYSITHSLCIHSMQVFLGSVLCDSLYETLFLAVINQHKEDARCIAGHLRWLALGPWQSLQP